VIVVELFVLDAESHCPHPIDEDARGEIERVFVPPPQST